MPVLRTRARLDDSSKCNSQAFLLPQAEALGWVCCQLRPAEKLCELVLDIDDIFSEAVSERLEELSILTQLSTLVLHNVASDAETEQLVAAVSPLTRLTRLELQFSYGEHGNGDEVPAFPWEEAVCQLIDLQELRVSSGAEHDYYGDPMFKGSLPAALSQLTALRCLEVLGMRDDYERDDSDELLLAELPALEKAALRMFTLSCPYPTLGHQQQAVCSRLVSLSLTLRTDYECTYLDTHLPPIVAPALTELLLDDIKLAPDSEQLSWLPGLPALRRLLLKDLKTASSQLPQGIVACSGLTELVLHRILLSFTMVNDPNKAFDRPECRLRSLPDAGSYLDQLVRLRLSKNAFVAVPPCLASATALQDLDMRKQMLQVEYGEPHSASMRGLHALDSLPRLRSLNIEGFEKSAAGIRRFRAAHPHVRVVFKSED